MVNRTLLAAAFVASVGMAAAAPASADVYFSIGPPPPRIEHVPPARPGWVWAPGYWDWRGHHRVWNGGHWIRARPGYVYNGPHWVHGHRGWVLDRGGWTHGRDWDRRHHRRWERGRDRDRDGVPNWRDRHPHNPHRR